MFSSTKSAKRILHVTPHLGGGVGKCISLLVADSHSSLNHEVLLLERPVRTESVDVIEQNGINVSVWNREKQSTVRFVRSFDLTMIHWWSHPSLSEWIGQTRDVKGSLIIWSHVSGMFTPFIPESIMVGPKRIVASSLCSRNSPNSNLWFGHVVHSGSIKVESLSELACPPVRNGAVFVGHLDYCKLHDDFVTIVAKVSRETRDVLIVGDGPNRFQIERDLDRLNLPHPPKFVGWVSNPLELMMRFKYFLYPLRPNHYGTGENVLIEALACGLLPLVQNNPAEMAIIKSTCDEWLPCNNPDDYVQRISETISSGDSASLSRTISDSARQLFAASQMTFKMNKLIHETLELNEVSRLFPRYSSEEELFLQTQEFPELYGDFTDETLDYERVYECRWLLKSKSKGSVYQYRNWFAGTELFGQMTLNLESNLARLGL